MDEIHSIQKATAFNEQQRSKKIFQYGVGQMKHPAVGNFLRDAAGMAVAARGNPEIAVPMIAARAAQEGVSIAERTARHYLG